MPCLRPNDGPNLKHSSVDWLLILESLGGGAPLLKGALVIRRILSLVDMITKPKFSNCPNVFKTGLFR